MQNDVDDGDRDAAFANLMVMLGEAYPSIRLREGTVRVYDAALRDLPIGALRSAVSRAVQESQFFPTVALIRSLAVGTADDAALLAWSALERAAQKVGAWQSLVVEDHRAAQALLDTFGSWPAFCATVEGPALALKRQEFLAAFRQAGRTRAMLPATRLAGQCEVSGRYVHAGPCWAGLVTSAWGVHAAKEYQLPAAPERHRLPDGGER